MATTPTSIATPPAAAASTPSAPASPSPSTPASSTPVSTPVPASPGSQQTPSGTGPETDRESLLAKMVSAVESKEEKKETPLQAPAQDAPAAGEEAEESLDETPTSEGHEEVESDGEPEESEEPAYRLEHEEFVGARDLAKKLDADPALKAALSPELRNEIMANARLAETGAAFREVFSSPEEAKIVAQTAQEYAGFSEAFSLIGKDRAQGTTELVRKMIEGSALRDENGELMKRPDGTYVTDGTATQFFTEIGERWFTANMLKKVESLGDENVQAALELVMESVGMGPSTATDPNQDPALAARKAELDAREAEFNRQRTESTQQEAKRYDESLNGDLNQLYESEQSQLLGLATGLSPLERGAVEAKLTAAVTAAIRSNVAYKMRRNQIRQEPQTAARRQKEIALAKTFLRDNFAKIAKPILAEAGVAAGRKAQERTAKQAARVQNARSEVQGGASIQQSGQPGTATNPAQQRAAVAEALKARTGKVPSDSEINIEMMLMAAKAKGFPV